MSTNEKTALAVGAHPDDIEFKMAGTLLLLREAGWAVHMLSISSGNCGSATIPPDELAETRGREAQQAADILGATLHPSFSRDLEILYDMFHLRKLAAIMHTVAPDIVLTLPTQDYMEDHMLAARLAVTAAFTHSMPNFQTDPPVPPPNREIALYHAMPHGLCDAYRRPVTPAAFTDVTRVHETKLKALRAHQSQHAWLDSSQGMDSYLQEMQDQDRAMGRLSGRFTYAEGWWRHLHFGYTATDRDPLADVLDKAYLLNPAFEETHQ